MPKPAPARYRTLNWSSYNAALRERGSLTVWFDPGMVWRAVPSGKCGRQRTFPDTVIQVCLTIKGEGRPENDPGDRFSSVVAFLWPEA